MPKIKLNGKELEVAPGKRVLEVCQEQGVEVPHYCYHPGLTPAGNCRICLVKVSNSRKLEVSCMYPCAENLEVTTEGPEVDAGRKAVLEYMLINHPLDCPICDKAGECDLQNYTYDYRGGVSRFEEQKVIRHTKDLGPNIKIWGTRCIACTRCVRFCDEIAGTGELRIVNRGDHSVVDVHPKVPIDNPLSLNVVDICPVGALIDKNFLFQARVWFTGTKETTCGGCAKGCSLEVSVVKNEVKRFRPRYNAAVNGYWICDAGRLSHGFLRSPNRLMLPRGDVANLGTKLAALASEHKGGVAIIASLHQTVEEMWLLKRLAAALGARVGFYSREGAAWTAKSGWAIPADKTPNRAGAQLVFGAVPGIEGIVTGLNEGHAKVLLSLNGDPELVLPASLLEAAKNAAWVLASDVLANPLTEVADVVVPSAAWPEKDGSWINRDGRVQRIRAVVAPPGRARAEVAWLQEVLVQMGAMKQTLSAEGVLKQALPGYDYGRIGALGAPVEAPPGASAEKGAAQ